MSAAVIPFRNVPNVLMVRCNYCSKELPSFRVHRLTGAQIICDHCLEWHNKALEFLSGNLLPGCQECEKSWEFLRDSQLGDDVRLYCVPRDGIYQVLCITCVQKYLPKRADLYKDTAFGRQSLKI